MVINGSSGDRTINVNVDAMMIYTMAWIEQIESAAVTEACSVDDWPAIHTSSHVFQGSVTCVAPSLTVSTKLPLVRKYDSRRT